MWQRIILGHFLGSTWSSYSQPWSGLSATWQCIVLAPQREMAIGAISPVNLLLLFDLLSNDFERLHIIPITPMIPTRHLVVGRVKPTLNVLRWARGL
jgi:hypothetical protein